MFLEINALFRYGIRKRLYVIPGSVHSMSLNDAYYNSTSIKCCFQSNSFIELKCNEICSFIDTYQEEIAN